MVVSGKLGRQHPLRLVCARFASEGFGEIELLEYRGSSAIGSEPGAGGGMPSPHPALDGNFWQIVAQIEPLELCETTEILQLGDWKCDGLFR